MDKTCGTCRYSLRSVVYCGHANERFGTAGLHAAGETGCRSWAERSESIEKVVCEMLAYLDRSDADMFRDRLEALGMDPDGRWTITP